MNGKIVWLENGKAGKNGSGLAHIKEEHLTDFANKGIAEPDLPDFLMQAVRENNIVSYQGAGLTRPIYELVYKGVTHRVAITIGDNGYIVARVWM